MRVPIQGDNPCIVFAARGHERARTRRVVIVIYPSILLNLLQIQSSHFRGSVRIQLPSTSCLAEVCGDCSSCLAMDVPEPSAVFPLTAFDRMLESTTFVTGWLVKGTLDTDALAAALKRVATKWRMLSGRVQSVKDGSVRAYRFFVIFMPAHRQLRRKRPSGC